MTDATDETAVDERSARAAAVASPSENQIRRKAYECWEARGRVHGRDKEDWFEAIEALWRPAIPDGAPIAEASETSSDLISAGMRAAGSMMLGAAHALNVLLGLSKNKKAEPGSD